MSDGKILKWQDNTPDWDPFATMELVKCQKAYNELQAKTSWISVKDRLPEERIIVLSYQKDLGMRLMYRSENCPGFNEITHWIPLPEPPK